MKNAKADVIHKLKDSLLIFCDIFNANISFTRKNALFILVYNEEKNKKKIIQQTVTNTAKMK